MKVLKAALAASTIMTSAAAAGAEPFSPSAPRTTPVGGESSAPYRQTGQIYLVAGGLLAIVVAGALMSGSDEDAATGSSSGRSPQRLDQERVRKAAADRLRASGEEIAAVIASNEYARNPALVSANLANRIALGLTGKGVRVGVMDTGVQTGLGSLSHLSFGAPFLADPGAREVMNGGGLTHGSMVAQVIAGRPGDGDESRGVAPGVTLHDLSYLSRPRGGDFRRDATNGDTAAAFDHALKNGIAVINLSMSIAWEGSERDLAGEFMKTFPTKVRSAMAEAASSGTVIVIAAGNSGKRSTDNVYSGASLIDDVSFGNVLTVVSLRSDGRDLAANSNWCGDVMRYCLAAVGENVPVISADGSPFLVSGTSFAAPVVSGSIALLKERFPELTSREVVHLVLVTADDMGEPGVDRKFGHGRLNMDRASSPVGDLRVVSGNMVSSPHIAAREAGVRAPEMAGGLAATLEGTDVMAIDDTGRGFLISGGALAEGGASRLEPLAPLAFRFSGAGREAAVIVPGEGAWSRHGSGAGFGLISPDMTLEGFSSPGLSPLGMMGRSYVLSFDAGTAFYGAALSKGGSRGAWAGMSAFGATYVAGAISEDGSLFGAEGPLGRGETWFLSAQTERRISPRAILSFGASYAKGKVSGEGPVTSLVAEAASARTAVRVKDVAGGALEMSLSAPLTAFSGRVEIDSPTGRDPSDGDVSTGVTRTVSKARFRTRFPADVGISYERPLSPSSVAGFSAVRRFDKEGGNKTFLGASLSVRF